MESKTLLYLDIAHEIDGRVILSARGRGPTFRGLTSGGLASKSCLRNILVPALLYKNNCIFDSFRQMFAIV